MQLGRRGGAGRQATREPGPHPAAVLARPGVPGGLRRLPRRARHAGPAREGQAAGPRAGRAVPGARGRSVRRGGRDARRRRSALTDVRETRPRAGLAHVRTLPSGGHDMRVSVRSGRALGALAAGLLLTSALVPSGSAQAQEAKKPNILFIMGDDIGWMQPGAYHRGLMVGETPNIDRIANEGGIFMDYVAMQSCTSGRNAFFTGMYPLRTGMIPPQLPGSPTYLKPGTPAVAKFLLDLGY